MRELEKGTGERERGTELSAAVTAFGLGCIGLERAKAAMAMNGLHRCRQQNARPALGKQESRWKFEDTYKLN
jgi:hypothetical protein